MRFSAAGAFAAALTVAVQVAGGDESRDAKPAEDPRILIEALEASTNEWQRQVKVSCSYQAFVGTASSLESAMRGELRRRKLAYTGKFVKRADSVRLSVRYVDGPVDVSDAKNGSLLTNVSMEEMSSNAIQIRYSYQQGSRKGYITVDPRPEKFKDTLVSGAALDGMCDYVNMLGGRAGTPMTITPTLRFAKAERTARRLDAERVEVTLHLKEDAWDHLKKVYFWTRPNPAVVEKIHLTQRNAAGEGPTFVAVAEDFTPCGEVVFPRVVRCINGSAKGEWNVVEWESNDVGVQSPTNEDFTIAVPDDVIVQGLATIDALGPGRVIDLSRIEASDLGRSRHPPPMPNDGPPARRTIWYWIVGLNVMIIAILALTIFRRRRRLG